MEAQGHLNSHQRDTLAHVFRHPLGHNIEWHAVISLLNSVGTVHETHKGRLQVSIGSSTEIFEPRSNKDIDSEQLTILRRFLKGAGLAPDAEAG